MTWRDWTKNTRLNVPQARPSDGWRLGAPDVYTCVAPAGYEKDPAVTAAIQEFDPGLIPLWRIQTWIPPQSGELVTCVHHGIGRFYPYPRHLRRQFHVEMPQLAEHPAPNFLDAIFEDQEPTGYRGPAAYIPWDWDTYRWCRRQFDAITIETYDQRLEKKKAWIEKMRAAYQAEHEYQMNDFNRWVMKKLDGVTPQDWAEYQELLKTGRSGGRRRAVRSMPSRTPLGRPLGV